MPQYTFFNTWISQSAINLYKNRKFFLCLVNTTTLTRLSSLIDCITAEIAPLGYNRIPVNIAGDGAYNSNTNRHEMPTPSITFSPDLNGASWQFQTLFLMEQTQGSPALILTSANINTSTDRITLNNHGKANGDKLIFTPDPLATLFTADQPITSTIYQVVNTTVNDFQLAPVGTSTPINIQTSGSGTFRARNANGNLVLLWTEDQQITLFPGQPYNCQIPFNLANIGNVNGI